MREDAIAAALESIAHALRDLGNADAGTPMGAIEALGAVLRDGFHEMAAAIRDAGDSVADAIDVARPDLERVFEEAEAEGSDNLHP